MRQIIVFFILSFVFSSLSAQYYVLPSWAEDLPYSVTGNDIYAIGISDPRMTDSVLARDVAINRALTMAVMFNESRIYYTSDYFEKRTEEYRWYVINENVEEMGRINAVAWVDEKSFTILESEKNRNGETMVLIRYTPAEKKDSNFFVIGEYYRQDFEISNTRALESVRSIKLTSKWKKTDAVDTIISFFHMTNWNNSISTDISYCDQEISPPGYSYEYASSIPDSFGIKTYNTSVNLKKGLWIAYIDSYMQSIMKISKNLNSKMETVFDDYKVNRDDGITEYSIEKLARSVCKNTLSFEYGGLGINKNSLFPRIYLKNNRDYYYSYGTPPPDGSVEIKTKKPCFCKRTFCKKNKKK